jgi:hypothetical protein
MKWSIMLKSFGAKRMPDSAAKKAERLLKMMKTKQRTKMEDVVKRTDQKEFDIIDFYKSNY